VDLLALLGWALLALIVAGAMTGRRYGP
jgi:hypothetical protein